MKSTFIQKLTNFFYYNQQHINATAVDSYWGGHTVNSAPFTTKQQSLEYLEWRFDQYPRFRETMVLWGDHKNQVILDYGCGPGNDITGFLSYSNAQKVIGMDVSEKALILARKRLSLHKFDPHRFELLKVSDAEPKIPLPDQVIDYIYCEGVLHHTSHPGEILSEFHRILKPGGNACIMVYNRKSIWLHLYVAYEKMVVQNAFPGFDLNDAFARSTDGEACPISRCYDSEDFKAICANAGFKAEFVGGYLSIFEIDLLKKSLNRALDDPRLPEEHKIFLKRLTYDTEGLPYFEDKYAGIGGVYNLQRLDLH